MGCMTQSSTCPGSLVANVSMPGVVIGSINQLSLCPTRNRKGYSYRAHQPHFGHPPFFDTTVVAIAEHLPASGESDHRAGRMPDRNLAVVVFVITRQARRIRG